MRVCVIAEGLSDKLFLESVVIPHIYRQNPRIDRMWVIESGGVGKTESIGYQRVKRVITAQICTDNAAVYTMMFDYYRFPKINIPGFVYQPVSNPYEKVKAREEAVKNAILAEDKLANFRDNICFHPFLMLHEYETLMFCDLNKLSGARGIKTAELKQLMREVSGVTNIELINDSPHTAPSKRINSVIVGYNKPSMGKSITAAIGINQMLAKCRHFKEWINWLCSL